MSRCIVDRPNPPGSLAISQLPTHTAPQVAISGEDGWTVSNALGYCMARTTHGIDRPGTWYFEVTMHSEPVRYGQEWESSSPTILPW